MKNFGNTLIKVEIPRAKRIFDIIMSFILFCLLSPLIIFILIWILLEQLAFKSSRGPIFYHEIRISKGKKFRFYKFRIFKQHILDKVKKEKGFIHTKPLEKNKQNLTFYGRFLKQIYMDEFPQLWNVLKGEMSLVGPRPTNVVNSELAKKRGDFTREVILCGITGPFQSRKGEEGILQQKADEEYIDFVDSNSGLRVVGNDLKIILRTIKKIFKAEGM